MGLGICCSTGRAQSISNIKLTINHTTAAVYTATFTETNSLKPIVTIYTDAGRTETITNGSLLDKTTYYYRAVLHGYQSYEGSFTVNGSNPSVNFTMTAAEKVTSLNVYARISDNNYLIKTIDLDDKYVGEQVTFTYPKYHKLGTTLYQVSNTHYNTHGGYYKWNNYTLEGNSVVLNYDGGTVENVVYYSEGEDIEGMTADAGSNADIRCSGGQGGRSTDELSLTTLGTGVYKLCSQVWGSANESGTYTYRAAGTDVLVHALTGSLDSRNVSFNVVSGTAAIKVQGSTNTGGRVLDYVYIQKLDDATVSVYNGDFENSTWDKGWLGTGSNKANAFAKQTSSQTWGAEGNFAEMWTNTSFSVEANLRQILVNVPAGNYTLSADILNSVAEPGGVLYAKVGNNSEITTAAENGSGANESVSFTVAEPSVVVVVFKTTEINGKSGWIAVDNFELKQFVPVTVTSAGWATLYTPYALDFSSLSENLTAYTATLDGSTVKLRKEDNVPANTGVVLEGKADTYYIPVAASSETEQGDLEGNATAATAFDAFANTTLYILTLIDNNNVQFNPCTSGEIAAGKAFLKVAKTTGAKALSVMFANDPTGIANVNAAEVAQPAKRIVNGQLVIEKNGKRYNAAGAEF